MELLEDGGGIKAIDEQCGAAAPIRMREEMEELDTTWICLHTLPNIRSAIQG